MATIQTNSVLPQMLIFPRPPKTDDPKMQAHLLGLQKTIKSFYDDIVGLLQLRPMVAPLAQRPLAGTAGSMFYASDTKALYIDDGTTWNVV